MRPRNRPCEPPQPKRQPHWKSVGRVVELPSALGDETLGALRARLNDEVVGQRLTEVGDRLADVTEQFSESSRAAVAAVVAALPSGARGASTAYEAPRVGLLSARVHTACANYGLPCAALQEGPDPFGMCDREAHTRTDHHHHNHPT